MKSTGWGLLGFRLRHCSPRNRTAPPSRLILQRARVFLTGLHVCAGSSSAPTVRQPSSGHRAQPRDKGAPALGRIRRPGQRTNHPGDKDTADVPQWGRGRLGTGPAPLQPPLSPAVAFGCTGTCWPGAAEQGVGGHSRDWGGANTPLHQAVGDTTAATLGKKVPFLAALQWHPGDQLCHRTQGTPALLQPPRDPSFTTAPSSLQISLEQSRAGLSYSSAGILPPRFKCWPSSAHRAQPAGVQSDLQKGFSHSQQPLCPRHKLHSLNAALL